MLLYQAGTCIFLEVLHFNICSQQELTHTLKKKSHYFLSTPAGILFSLSLTDHYRLDGDPLLYYRLDFHIPVNTDYNQIIRIIFWTPVRLCFVCDFLESKTSDPKTSGINFLRLGFLQEDYKSKDLSMKA